MYNMYKIYVYIHMRVQYTVFNGDLYLLLFIMENI